MRGLVVLATMHGGVSSVRDLGLGRRALAAGGEFRTRWIESLEAPMIRDDVRR